MPIPAPGRPGRHVREREERRLRTEQLISAARESSDPARRRELLDEVVLINRGVAQAVAWRYRGRGAPQADLEQAAYEGLVKAVHRFDPTVRPDLLTYAVPTIRGEVLRWFRDLGWMVRPPRRVQELQWRVNRSLAELSQAYGREPTMAEVSHDVGSSETEVAEAVRAFGLFQPASLDRAAGPAAETTLAEVVDLGEQPETEDAETRVMLRPAVRRLGERDRRILYLHFYEQRSQSAIGAELGISQVQVSRQLERIYRDLRAQLA